jgi:hypothetical protein
LNIEVLRRKFRMSEVASREHLRIHGASNLRTIPDGWRVLKTIIRLGLSKPRQNAGTFERFSRVGAEFAEKK